MYRIHLCFKYFLMRQRNNFFFSYANKPLFFFFFTGIRLPLRLYKNQV